MGAAWRVNLCLIDVIPPPVLLRVNISNVILKTIVNTQKKEVTYEYNSTRSKSNEERHYAN